MSAKAKDIVCIAGSAGALSVLPGLLAALPAVFPFAVVVVLHRMRNAESDLNGMLQAHLHGRKVIEPDDKDPIKPNHIYLAPQNYHLLVEDGHFSLDYSEAIMYSRPSIDVSFESIANAYGNNATAILLSGANADGAAGLQMIKDHGGVCIVQDPATAQYPTMPQAAIDLVAGVVVCTPEDIDRYLSGGF